MAFHRLTKVVEAIAAMIVGSPALGRTQGADGVTVPSALRNYPFNTPGNHYLLERRSSREGSILSKNPDEERSRKELAHEKRERLAAEGRSAMAEIAARNAFVAKNTARLRQLRLAKEAADREAEAGSPPEPVKKPRKKRMATGA
ncbi:hypothetical protein [Bradyrhizobium sp.]|uniref:hypothetical protein n=1 Tax=Bradyrhizobium sp. TaxID=376 RepID=UPI0040384F0E